MAANWQEMARILAESRRWRAEHPEKVPPQEAQQWVAAFNREQTIAKHRTRMAAKKGLRRC